MDEAMKQTAVTVGEAYISGALTALEDAPRTKLFYELLAEIAEAAHLRAYLPHRVTDPVAAADLDPRAVYEIDRAHVRGAAVLIAYAGIPSFGVCIEGLDGEAAAVVKDAVSSGRLFGAGLRDLVGRYALRGPELAAFVLRDVLERSLAETARTLGMDTRTAKRHVATAQGRVGLAEDAEATSVAQWLVTELIAPPTPALQLHLFTGGRAQPSAKVDRNRRPTGSSAGA